MLFKIGKKLLFLLGTVLIIPLVIGLFFGGGYILYSLLRGHSMSDSLRDLVYIQQIIQPYIKYLMIIFIIPAVLKVLKKSSWILKILTPK
ncbi:hypothetical protein ABID52_001826 [Fictibacillus halophilus]|uniref:Uncharacterized protein n=1 Tax=Fictibacillus halophilus TaxID=1610490 RepID=A0ABV2LI29_9BACL